MTPDPLFPEASCDGVCPYSCCSSGVCSASVLRRLSSETETSSLIGVDTSQDGHTVSVGVSALFYIARWDMTRAYVVPRYAYSDNSSSIEGPFAIVRDSSGNAHDVSVSFGAQHNLGDRFAIYGELGFAYERFTTDITTSELRRSSFGTRSGVGVVVYF